MTVKAIAFDLCKVLVEIKDIELTPLEFELSEKFDYKVDGKLYWDWARELTGFNRKKLEGICWDLIDRLYELQESDIFSKIPHLKFATATNHLSMIKVWLKNQGIYDDFYCHVISEDVKCEKPDLEFYEILTEKLGEKPEEVLFIDDKIENIEGAREAGLQVLHYNGRGILSKEINNYLEKC